jgi:ZIP family zinc transporter
VWLVLDALAPLAGVVSTYFYSLSQAGLGLVLAVFCGFFLYIGAADLLPESHHRHPKRLTATLNIAGAALIWLTIHLAAF